MNERTGADAEAEQERDLIEPSSRRPSPRRALRAVIALVGVIVAGRWIRRIVRGRRDT